MQHTPAECALRLVYIETVVASSWNSGDRVSQDLKAQSSPPE